MAWTAEYNRISGWESGACSLASFPCRRYGTTQMGDERRIDLRGVLPAAPLLAADHTSPPPPEPVGRSRGIFVLIGRNKLAVAEGT